MPTNNSDDILNANELIYPSPEFDETNSESKKIFDYFNQKYGNPIGLVGLVKSIATASVKVNGIKPLNILAIAPSQQFKSRTSKELFSVFNKSCLLDWGSDFTIHSLIRFYDNGKKCKNKTCLVNDLTLLLSSKIFRAKERLLNALAESLSDGKYTYSDNLVDTILIWEPKKYNIIANITYESYRINQNGLIRNTFAERMLSIYYKVDDEVFRIFNREVNQRKEIGFGQKISLMNPLVKISDEDLARIEQFNKRLKVNSLSSSLGSCQDKIISLLYGNANLNRRNHLTENDFKVVECILSLTYDFNNKDSKIIDLYLRGDNIERIAQILKMNTSGIYRVLDKLRRRGVI